VETWQTVSDEAKDFISKILLADPDKRITIEGMQNHPWMSKDLDQNVKLNAEVKK